MRKEWFEKLNKFDKENKEIICASDLRPYLYDKTLLYGYTCERKTFHAYVKNENIYVVVYENDYSTGKARPKNMMQIIVNSNHDYVPDKRLYPERCDYHFCLMLKERGIHLPFTTWNDGVNIDNYCKYYGYTLEDVI